MSNRIVEAQDEVILAEDQELINVNNEDEFEDGDESGDAGSEAHDSDAEQSTMPTKFKGKTITDVVKAYENLEREFGRKNNEIGELRRLTDNLLRLERPTQKEEAPEDNIDADSLLDNPKEAIRKSLENDPTIKQLKESMINQQRTSDLKEFEGAHPDWKETMASPEFVQWIDKSKVRKAMLIAADRDYDYQTGADLLAEFKETHPTKSAEDEAEEQRVRAEKKEQDYKKVSGQKRSSSTSRKRKIYSRSQLIQLQIDNPSEYNRRFEEFQTAYAEGRVK